MKIFYIATTVHIAKKIDDGLGSTTHTYFVAKELARLGHEVHIISKRYPNDSRHEAINGIQIHRLKRGILSSGQAIEKIGLKRYFRPFKALFNIILAYQAGKLTERYGCDMILERNHSLGVGAWTSYLTGVPMVLEVIDSIISKRSVKRAKKIIAYTDRFFSKKDQDKVRIVKVGFDPETFFPDFCDIEYDLCYSGSFKPWDGVEDLIEAIKLLVNKYKLNKIKAVLVGSGEQFEHVQKMVRDYKLEANITMTGRIDFGGVRSYINRSKCCVAPYNIKNSDRGEFGKYGFYYAPLKIVEYMACGKPVAATKYAMIKDILPEAGAEFFNEGDIDGLASSLAKLLQSDQSRQMGEHNLERSRDYTWRKVVAEFDEIFKS